jgi:hypothetical protein
MPERVIALTCCAAASSSRRRTSGCCGTICQPGWWCRRPIIAHPRRGPEPVHNCRGWCRSCGSNGTAARCRHRRSVSAWVQEQLGSNFGSKTASRPGPTVGKPLTRLVRVEEVQRPLRPHRCHAANHAPVSEFARLKGDIPSRVGLRLLPVQNRCRAREIFVVNYTFAIPPATVPI